MNIYQQHSASRVRLLLFFPLFIISLGFPKLVALKMSDKVIKTKRACVVVLGDIGRSPRMQYHSKSLADNHFTVVRHKYKVNTSKNI